MKDITNLRGYGDIERLKEDSKLLIDIILRQGSNFVCDVLAECMADTMSKFDLSEHDKIHVRNEIVNDLKEAISERI